MNAYIVKMGVKIKMNWINVVVAGGVILAISLILGVCLAIANKYFEVEDDDKVEKLTEKLPLYNCGACGYVGCEALARAILNGEVSSSKACKVISEDNAKKLKEYCLTIKDNNGENIKLD